MRDANPGQNEESGVVRQQMVVALPGLRRPAQEVITAVDGIGCRAKGEAGHRPATGIGQILHQLGIEAKINWQTPCNQCLKLPARRQEITVTL